MTYFPKKRWVLAVLLLSICLSFLSAIYKGNDSPPCFNSDEAAFAYNAYSILHTGADEYGNVMPLRLKSFGDYKMPLYSYFSIPFIATFGLNELGARALNIFIALLFPFAMYALVKELFEKEEIAAIASLFISVSLGKGIMERQAHEGILASFLIILATIFFVRFFKKETYTNAIFFVVFLVLSLFAYQSSRIFAVFFFIYTLFYYFILRKSGSLRNFFIILLLIGIGLFAITDVIYKPARVQNLFLTNTAGFTLRINELIGEGGSRIAYNKLTEGVKEFVSNQMTYYSPQFLAIDGDSNYRFGFPEMMGPMTIVEYLFIFVGMYFLFRNNDKWRYLLLGLIIAAPITAALSWNGLSLTRAIFLIMILLIVASYGVYYFVIQFKKRKFFLYLITALFLAEVICLFYSWDFYLNHYPKRAIVTQAWECGYSDLGDYVKQNYNKFDTFYITQKNGEPYIFLLFYLKYPPQLYQKQASLSAPDQFGFGQVEKFDKFNFSIPSSAFQQSHVAIIGYPDDFNNVPLDKTKLKKIVVNNLPIFWIYENKWFLSIFLLILFFGTFLRFYQLGTVPRSMDWDEVSFGYNAYSVLNTGKDEYGVSYPLLFKAFGEYKQPVYAYLDVVSIDLFGLNSFAVRFPSAFFGSISIIFVYLLVSELFNKYTFSKKVALFSTLFYAISPWSIQFSRIAFEANVALSLVISAVWLFLKGLTNKNKWYVIGGTLLLCLSEFTYISVKLLGPLFFISLIFYGFSFFKKQKVTLFTILLLFILISGGGFLSSHSIARGQDVLFTNNQTEILKSSVIQLQVAKQQHNIFGEIIYNRRVVYAEKFVENYLSHYNPIWLTVTGDSVPRHHAPGMGNIYIISLPFIILGICFLLFRYFSVSWIIFVWFLIAPLASSLTSDAPSSLRSLLFLPTWQIFEASGIVFLFQMIKKKNIVFFLQIVLVCLYAVNFYFYMNQYYRYTNSDENFQKAWQFGYKDTVIFADQERNSDKRVIFSNLFEQPYIFYLFYSQYDPALYQNSGGSTIISKECYAIANAYFGNCKAKLRNGDYYIALQNELYGNGNEIKRITYANGDPAVVIYKQK